MRDLFALAFGAILENVEGQRCCFSDVFGCEVAATLCIKRCADILIGRLELPVDAEQGHQELRTAALEFENIDFVVADVAKQLVPDRPLAIESPAAQRLETDLPAVGDVFFSHHGVAHLFLLQDRCPHDNAVRRRSQVQTLDVPFCRPYQPSDERTEQCRPQELRLGLAQAQHQYQRISRRCLEAVILVKQLRTLVQGMNQQGTNARVLRHVHRPVDGILQ